MQAKISNSINVGDVILDLYQILDILGEGGFGKVYKVRHKDWNIDLAVKSPKPEIVAAAGGVENFEREAQTWVNLGLHPHTVSCYYVRRIESSPLIFAEYVAGGSLQDWISSRQLYDRGATASRKRLLDIAIQFAWGLHYAHEQGLIHQDVKPANVMMTPEGVVKVTDFGLANAVGGNKGSNSDREKVTGSTLMVAGSGGMTPAYCSPEQASRKTLTRRSDLWSWGLSVLEMFQGDRTWPVGTIAPAVLESYLEGEKDLDLPQMPPAVADLLRRCFRENPDDRPCTMLEVANQLQEIYADVTGEVYPRRQPKTGQDLADSLNNRAVSLLDLGKQEEALQLWKQAFSSAPLHPESTYNQGLVLWRSLRINDDTLVRELDEVRKSHPENWLGNYYLGLVHLERNDCAAANTSFTQIQAAGNQEVEAALKETQNRLSKSFRLLHNFETDSKRINSVCISGNGKYVLCGKHGGTLELHSLATKERRIFEGHLGEGIKSVCFTPNHRYAVSLSNLTLKLWELVTGECLWSIEIDRQVIEDRKSPDNRFELSANPLILTLRETATGEVLHCFGRSGDEVFLTPDSHVLSVDGQPKLWEVATGEVVQTFDGHTRKVNSICISPDGRYLLSTSEDTTLKLWEVGTGRCKRTFQGHKGAVKAVCISSDGRFALSAGEMTLKVWEIATGRCLRTLAVNDRVNSVCISPNGRFAVSGGNATLKLWAFNCSHNLYLAPMMLCRVQASETVISVRQIYEETLAKAKDAQSRGDAVAAAKYIRKVRSLPGYSRDAEAFKLWTQLYLCLPRKAFSNGWEGATFTGHTGYVNSVILSSDGQYALSGSADNTLKLWDVESGSCLRTFEGYFQGTLNSVCLSSDGRYALSGSYSGSMNLWEIATGRCVKTFEERATNRRAKREFSTSQSSSAVTVCFSPDTRFALSGSNNGAIHLWDLDTSYCLRIFKSHTSEITSICFSPDGLYILSSSKDKTVKLWAAITGVCLRTFVGHSEEVTSVCFSPNGRYILSGSNDKTLKLWDIATGKCLRTFNEHTEAITSVCFSADGRYILSGSYDNTLKLWEVETGKCVRTFLGHASAVKSVCLSLDGRYALSGSNDGSLKLWVLDWELEDKMPADWDEGARAYLENFLSLHTPYAASISNFLIFPESESEQQKYRLDANTLRLYSFLAGVLVISATLTAIFSLEVDWVRLAAVFVTGGVFAALNGWFKIKQSSAITYLIGKFGIGLTIAILLETMVLGVTLGIGFWLGFFTPFIVSAVLATSLPLAWMLNTKADSSLKAKTFLKLSIAAVAAFIVISTFKWGVLSFMGFTPLNICKDIKVATTYVNQGGNPNIRYRGNGNILLKCALNSGSDDIAKLLISKGANVNARIISSSSQVVDKKFGATLLHDAVWQNNIYVAEMLIDNGADINAKFDYRVKCADCPKDLITALHLAVNLRRKVMVFMLIEKGADINAKDSFWRTPLTAAEKQNYPEIVKLLKKHAGTK